MFVCFRYFPQEDVSNFEGVDLDDLSQLEQLFETNIVVYSLQPVDKEEDQDEDEESSLPDIAASLVRRSHRHYPRTLYLNLHKDHFSYIKNLKMYSKSYRCSKCGKYWKHAGKLHRHELTCEAKTRRHFPGNAYNVPPTVFEELDDEGIHVAKDLRFFKYFATFDFESMFSKTDLPENTAKLEWENKHVPLSVSVCSNVPGYQDAKCFITNGNSHDLIKEFVDYLVNISQESYRLLLNDFEAVFAAIDLKIDEVSGDDNVDELAEMLVEMQEEREERADGGINVLESDDDDEEAIEPENEDDRAFIDDEVDSESQDVDFYRALNRNLESAEQEHEEQLERDTEKETKNRKRPHPLVKLKVKTTFNYKHFWFHSCSFLLITFLFCLSFLFIAVSSFLYITLICLISFHCYSFLLSYFYTIHAFYFFPVILFYSLHSFSFFSFLLVSFFSVFLHAILFLFSNP